MRYAFRQLRRAPAFSVAAIVTLAIGIAATTAIFSAVNATLLRPLPYPHPEQIIDVRTTFPDGTVTSGGLSAVELLASIVGDLQTTLLIVLGATLLLLLLACLNVTNLLLARGAGRSREMAARAALGASRGRLMRYLLTEALVLACAGTVLGLALAWAALRVLLALGASKLPRLTSIPFDARVLFFVLAVLLFMVLAMGLVPAWRTSGSDLRTL